METIITLLIALLPILLKFLYNILVQPKEKDGRILTEMSEPMGFPVLHEMQKKHEMPLMYDWEEEDEVVEEYCESDEPVQEEGIPMTVKKDTVPVVEACEPDQKEKLDLKKLVMYSEIMKPKYDDKEY